MNIFTTLMNKVFPNHAAQAATTTETTNITANATNAATTPMTEVDVEATFTEMAKQHDQTLNWKTSIVDLMKLVGMDSSLQNRKALATELNYTGDMNDSASMNIWLHKEVLKKFASNGGKIPADLLN